MPIIFLVISLPIAEIIGFSLIGGEIGAGSSLLWVVADVFLGFTLLSSLGTRKPENSEKGASAGRIFNDVCIIVGSLLLIFPGFISDFLALPLLIQPLRRMIFLFLKNKHENILNDVEKTSTHFKQWQRPIHKNDNSHAKTIEGDFKKIDEDNVS